MMPEQNRLVGRWIATALAFIVWACLAIDARAQSGDPVVTPLLALTNTAQTAKPSPGTVIWVSCYNPNAATVWVQFFDSIGSITVGTTPPNWSFQIPPTSVSAEMAPPTPSGIYYAANGMQLAATTTSTGGTAPSTALPVCDVMHR